MKKIYAALIIFLFILGYFYFTKTYPVAMVNGNLIWYSEWQTAFQGEEHFLNNGVLAQAKKDPIDFNSPQHSDLRNKAAKGALMLLIQKEILKDAGKKLDPNFENESVKKANEALIQSQVTDSSVAALYGFSLNDFINFVVMPEAYKEMANIYLAPKHIDFSDWFTDQSKKASVRLFLIPYKWDGVSLN